jgi:hypothetical protein
LASDGCEFVAVVEAVADGIAGGAAVEAGLEAVGVEAAGIGFWVGAFVVGRCCAGSDTALDGVVARAEARTRVL